MLSEISVQRVSLLVEVLFFIKLVSTPYISSLLDGIVGSLPFSILSAGNAGSSGAGCGAGSGF
jgi:hypothetical protein